MYIYHVYIKRLMWYGVLPVSGRRTANSQQTLSKIKLSYFNATQERVHHTPKALWLAFARQAA